MSATYNALDSKVRFSDPNAMDGPKRKGVVCSLTRLSLGLLALIVAVLVLSTFLITYFVTKDAFEGRTVIIEATTTTEPPTTTAPPPTVEPLPVGLRLNKTLIPSHYNVELQPYIYDGDDFSFVGSVEIWFRCDKTTNTLVLHIDTLSINEDTIVLQRADGTDLPWSKWEEDKSRHFFKLYPNDPLQSGEEYYLSMEYDGTLIHDDLGGFYRSSYDEGGVKKFLATTQFQRTYARRALPCFDEPFFKATFNVTLVRRGAPYSSISNMPIVGTEKRTDPNGVEWFADIYDKTVEMSPYLLAFVVSDFIKETSTTPRGTKFNLWARGPFIESVEYALNVSGAIMEAFEDYTNVSFVLPETDQIAIPDFAAGAMENWGLITYRETALLYNSNFSRTIDRQYVGRVIAHELAHMWFGNLLTCDWWDDTWLNEGFATYFANVGVDLARQDWDTDWQMAEFFLRTMWGIMVTDGNAQSQPVFVKGLEHHSELGKAFSSITYRKGGSVIRMMKYFLGEETFRKGLERYLKRHAFKTVVRNDLYQALEEQAELDGTVSWDTNKRNLSDIMDTWILQQNYPLVKVTLNNNEVTIEQSQFLYDSNATVSEESPFGEYLWDIFFTHTSEDIWSSNTSESTWIYRQKSVTLPYSGTGWMLANLFHQGFLRTWYDDDTYDSILKQLKDDHEVFPVENRGQIIDDAFNLAVAGIVDEVRALRTLEYLTDERNYLPWYIALNVRLPYMKRMLYSTGAYEDLRTFIKNIVEPTYVAVGWDNDNAKEHLQKYLRTIIIDEACEMQLGECVESAMNLYRAVMAADDYLESRVHPDLRSAVYCAAIRNGGIDEWNHALDRYNYNYTVYIAYEKTMLLDALSCTREPWIQNKYLELAMKINSTEAFVNIANKESSQSTVWRFLEQNWANIPSGVKKFDILQYLTNWMSNDYHLKQLRTFFDGVGSDVKSGVSKSNQDKLTTKVKENISWVSKNLDNITNWLREVNSTFW